MKATCKKGFTLPELIIAASILVIFVTVIFIHYTSVKKEAAKQTCIVSRRQVAQIDGIYCKLNDVDPADYETTLERLKDSGMLDQDPVCSCGGTFTFEIVDGERVLVCSHHGP